MKVLIPLVALSTMKTLLPYAACCLFALVGTTHYARAHDDVAVELAGAANRWLATLTPDQRSAAQFVWESDQRQNWHFVPDRFIQPEGKRHGLSIKQMTPQQRVLAHALLSVGLSHKAYLQANTIMALETILHELENKNPIRDPELYYVSIFGTPAPERNWAWRFEGHHLSLQFTLIDGHHFSVTPSFFGSNPGEVRVGPLAGLRVLAEEEDLGRQLVRSLSDEQRKAAVIDAKAPQDIITGQDRKINKGAFFPAKGIRFDKLNAGQQQLLLDLLAVYTGKYHAQILRQVDGRNKIADGREMYFAWAGGVEPGQGHYYRVQTPRFLFEYDNTQNDANHVHAVWREFDGDFGEDLLRKHYESSSH